MRWGSVFPHLPSELMALVNRVQFVQDASVSSITLDTATAIMRYNPEFVADLPQDELVSIVEHELRHLAAGAYGNLANYTLPDSAWDD